MMRKFLALILMTLTVFLLAACKAGVPSYNLQYDPATEKGTANFTIRVPKNTAPEVGNNFTKPEEEGYIKSPEALLDLFKKKVPSGYTVKMKDEPKMVTDENGKEVDHGNFAYTVTFTFKGIDDYNKKIMKLVGQSSWDGANEAAEAKAKETGSTFSKITPATLSKEVKGDEQTVTFTEDLRVIDVIGYWSYKTLTTDTTGVWKDLFKDTYKDYPVTFANTINLDLAKYTLKMGDNVQEYQYRQGPIVTAKATVPAVKEAANSDSNNVNTDEANPATGDPQVATLLILGVVATGSALLGKKLKK